MNLKFIKEVVDELNRQDKEQLDKLQAEIDDVAERIKQLDSIIAQTKKEWGF